MAQGIEKCCSLLNNECGVDPPDCQRALVSTLGASDLRWMSTLPHATRVHYPRTRGDHMRVLSAVSVHLGQHSRGERWRAPGIIGGV